MWALRSSKTGKGRREACNRLPSQLTMPSHFLWEETPQHGESTLSASQVPCGKHMQAPEQMGTPTHHTVTYFVINWEATKQQGWKL